MKRIVVLVNKDFEYKGFIEGLRDTIPVFAGTNGRDAECRIDNLRADIYCIQHLFNPGENSSNSEVKYGLLKDLFKSNVFRLNDVDGVLSVSTAESTPTHSDDETLNGCVCVGNKFFISDQRANDPHTKSQLDIGTTSTKHTEFYGDEWPTHPLYAMLNIMKMPLRLAPHNPNHNPSCLAYNAYGSVGVVNVMDYSCYGAADASAYNMYLDNPCSEFSFPVCIETTHGVVKKALKSACNEFCVNKNIPVHFVSPIVDRYLKFDEDVDGTDGKQNFVCSYNGGVVVGNALKLLAM